MFVTKKRAPTQLLEAELDGLAVAPVAAGRVMCT